jgi:serine/threonine protein kinase
MSAPADLTDASVGEADDALRALLSSILSGRYKQQLYLWHVSELCHDEPESAPRLLALVERYHRLGRLPAEQYQQLKATIEQAMGARPDAGQGAHQGDAHQGDAHHSEAGGAPDIDSEEVLTHQLRDAGAPSAARAPQAAPTPPAQASDSVHAVDPAEAGDASNAGEPRFGIGTVLRDRYELLQLLGRGGMACVYKARDLYRTSLGVADCLVAIKVVQANPERPGGIDALGREFHNAQRLSHPNVVNVYDIDREGSASFYSMEFLDGVQLGRLLSRPGGPLPRRYALAIIRDIGAAIAHAHSRGVVHSDLKPHNIMITRDGQVRVLDFGSGIVRPGEPWISEMSPGGDYRQATPAYASCEQLQGWCADPRDDIYALACLAYQLLAGRHPFDQRSSLVARGRRLRARRPAGMRGESWRALRRGLAWSREQRDLTVEKWLDQLGVADAAAELPPLARLENAPPPRLWPQRSAAAALVLVSLGLAAFAIDRQSGVDWPQLLAGVRHSWDDAWQQLQSPEPILEPVSTPAAATSHHPVDSAQAPAQSAVVVSASPAVRSRPVTRAAEAPRVGFAAASYDVAAGEPAARIVVRRLGSTDGELSFIWWTEAASAQPDVDYAELGRRIEKIPSGADKITLFVPIISNPRRGQPSRFYVALDNTGAAASAGVVAPDTRAEVTLDRGE